MNRRTGHLNEPGTASAEPPTLGDVLADVVQAVRSRWPLFIVAVVGIPVVLFGATSLGSIRYSASIRLAFIPANTFHLTHGGLRTATEAVLPDASELYSKPVLKPLARTERTTTDRLQQELTIAQDGNERAATLTATVRSSVLAERLVAGWAAQYESYRRIINRRAEDATRLALLVRRRDRFVYHHVELDVSRNLSRQLQRDLAAASRRPPDVEQVSGVVVTSNSTRRWLITLLGIPIGLFLCLIAAKISEHKILALPRLLRGTEKHRPRRNRAIH